MRPQEPQEFGVKNVSLLNPSGILAQIETQLAGKELECTGGGLYMPGGKFETDPAPVNLSQVGTYSDQGYYTPAYVDGNLETASYGFYVWGIRGFAGKQTIGFTWLEGAELADSQNCWVGLGNLTKDTWDWYRYPEDKVLSLDSFGPYRSASGHVLMAFVLLGDQPATLDYMEIGVPELRATGADGLPEETPDYPLLGAGGSLPAAFDLSEDCAPINDQMSWGSCTAFAVGDGAYNYELGFMYGQLGWDLHNPKYKVSPKHLYVVSGELEGFPPGGTYGRYTEQVIGGLTANGVATELNAPYDLIYNNNWTPAALADAQVLIIENWEEVPCNTWEGINTVKQIIAQQRKVLPMQAYLDDSFFDYQPGLVWYPTGYFAGGHAMCIVGYDDARGSSGAFKVRNSWSEYWGDDGYVWIAYEAFLSPAAAIRAWTITEDYNPEVVNYFGLAQPGNPPVTGLAATDGTRADGIGLSWHPSTSATQYTIYRDQLDNEVGTTAQATFLDSSITDSYGHVYWVRADSSPLCAPDTGYLASMPSIEAVNPTEGVEGDEVSFSAAGLGSAPLQYNWSFGGGATPNTSTEARPAVTLTTPGTYNASLKLTNGLGSDTFNFTLTVTGVHPVIQRIAPRSGFSGDTLQLVAVIDGSPTGYSWNFGGGGTPNTSTQAQPAITLGAAGQYEAMLTIHSEWGDDIFYFTLSVLDASATAWTMPGHDSFHSGQSPVLGPQTNNVKWKYYIGSPDGLPANNGISQIFALPDGDVIISGTRSNKSSMLWRLNPDGTEQWSKWHFNEQYYRYDYIQIGRYSGNLYYNVSEGLFAVDPETGVERWHVDGGSPIDEDSAGRLWLIGTNSIFALNTSDGSVASEPITIGNRYLSSKGVLAPNGILFTAYKNSNEEHLLAFDTNTETPVGSMWIFELPSGLALSADGNNFYVATDSIHTYDTQNCQQLWWFKGTGKQPCVMADGTMVCVDEYGLVYALAQDTGQKLWELDVTDRTDNNTMPAIGRDGTVYFGGNDKKVYAVKDGVLKWTSQEATSWEFGSTMVIGPDGTLYAADRDGWLWAFGHEGSGEERVPPYILDVTPYSGEVGETISPVAGAYGSAPLDYEWDFGGGATPNTSTSPHPTITLGSVGTYYASLTIHNNYNDFVYDFLLRVYNPGGNTEPAAALTADPMAGNAPLDIEFNASGSTDLEGPIASYDWAPRGDHVYDNTLGHNSALTYTYTLGGTYQVWVRVTDLDGLTDETSITVEVSSDQEWRVQVLDTVGNTGIDPMLSMVDGKPAIAYYNSDSLGTLYYIRATDAVGDVWDPRVPVTNPGGVRAYIAIINGKPAIAYYETSTKHLCFVRASDQDGNAWESQVTVYEAYTGDLGAEFNLTLVQADGRPAIAFTAKKPYPRMNYMRALDVNGANWPSEALDIDGTGVQTGNNSVALLINSKPVVCYSGESGMMLVRASDAAGTAWGTPAVISPNGRCDQFTFIGGTPAIALTTNDGVAYMRAKDTLGSTWNDPVTIDINSIEGSIVDVDNALISLLVNGPRTKLYVSRSIDLDGTTWQPQEYLTTSDSIWGNMNIANVNECPAVAWFDNNDYELKYAVYH